MAYKEKRACNSQCILCMHQIVDESAGYAIFSQPRTKEIGMNTVLAIYCEIIRRAPRYQVKASKIVSMLI